MMIENAINTSDILINEIFFQQHKKKTFSNQNLQVDYYLGNVTNG